MGDPADTQKTGTPAVRIVEVGPRDGLQHEPTILPTERKVAWINALSRTGVAEIEAGSFVSPKAVPQLADTDDVFRKIARRPGMTYSALVPNARGLERALAVDVRKIAVFTAASETFTQRNINATIRESLDRFRPVITSAKGAGLTVRGYVSTAFVCPYEGKIDPARVVDVLQRLFDLGADEVSLGDTIGRAAPTDVRRLLDLVTPRVAPARLSLHFHDTYGMAIANVLTAWEEYGIQNFDTSAGGLGGCPYAPGASGNVATEDVVYALKASGAAVSVNEKDVIEAMKELEGYLRHPLASRLSYLADTLSAELMTQEPLTTAEAGPAATLAERVKNGDPRAIARLLSLLDDQHPDGRAALDRLGPPASHAVTIGITGYPGAGKSTLIDRLTNAYRAQGKKVGILAVDPSSPETGGAILGDRIRMQSHACDPGVFIRSVATRGHLGGAAVSTGEAIRVLEAGGYDAILIETVGVGQNEREIRRLADTVIVVLAPGLGDEVQTLKAGLLDIADIVVLNKGDREGADAAWRELREWYPLVIRTVAVKDEGVPELLEALAMHRAATAEEHNDIR
jgi:hydroxymethylglutaryl-CoA lyase